MQLIERLINKIKEKYYIDEIKRHIVSIAVTFLFVIYNGFLAIKYSSVWYSTIGFYYFILVIIRSNIIICEKFISHKKRQIFLRKRVYSVSSLFLLILNICLIIPIYIMVNKQKEVNMIIIPAIAMAAYTTVKFSVRLFKLNKSTRRNINILFKLLNTTNFIDDLVSILNLQNTLIMIKSTDTNIDMFPFTAVSSGIIFTIIMYLSINVFIRGIKYFKNEEKNAETI